MSAEEKARSKRARREPTQKKAQAKDGPAKKRRAAKPSQSQPRPQAQAQTQPRPQAQAQAQTQAQAHVQAQAKRSQRAETTQPRNATPKRTAPKHAAPKHAAPKDAASQRLTTSQDTASKEAPAQGTPSRASKNDEGILGRILPVLAAALALVAIALLYRYVFPPLVAEQTTDDGQLTTETSAEDANTANNVYQGVEDPYTYTGYFSTGSDELDQQVKAFCDAIADPTLDARSNAQKVFQKIAGNSTYTIRSVTDKPGGPEWYRVCAEQYFSTATPDQGIHGSGDFYDYASALCYCLRYFGFSDALAVPLASLTGSEYKAVVVVTDTSGTSCVCDPSQYANGWMNDLYAQSFLVENIGQDTAQEEAMGLTVQEVESDPTSVDG